jgi:magnesium-transporting ATPase (P-type)
LEVLKHCQTILRDDTPQELTHAAWDNVVQANDDLARQEFRVLGLAARKGDREVLNLKAQDLEQNLIFIGLVAMFDPPRPEVPEAIDRCHQAGIKVTMVTGDYGLTAEAIARNIGLISDRVRVVYSGIQCGRISPISSDGCPQNSPSPNRDANSDRRSGHRYLTRAGTRSRTRRSGDDAVATPRQIETITRSILADTGLFISRRDRSNIRDAGIFPSLA